MQMPFAKHDDVVGALPADASDDPLDERVLPGRMRCTSQPVDAVWYGNSGGALVTAEEWPIRTV